MAEHSNPNLWALLIAAECYLAPTVPGAPVGGSFAPGYVDLAARATTAYRYAVATYTAEGRESPLSSPLNAGARPLRAYLPLVVRR